MPDLSADEAAIIELIHRNRIAIWTNDFELWETCFVHAPYTTRCGWWRPGGIFLRKGWEEMRERVRADHPSADHANAYDTKVTNLLLRIGGDMAWATFEQEYPNRYHEPGRGGPGIVHEIRFFERHDGEWKIALLGFLDGNAGALDERTIRLDAEANVLWRSPKAIEAIEASDDLVVRGGKLRFRDASTNRKFLDALGWAAALDNGYMSRNGSVPVVAEAGEGEQTRIYWIIADAGMILLSFGDQGLSEKRLEVATLVFGLSPTQRQLAAFVAEGLSLNEIATRLGITANTARTHLDRVFDKVGVRTQTALVRVLLSTAAPI
jgi:DNA-binding CsgD family transcriptional regulator